MANNCRGCNDPQVENEGIDCDGQFVSDECVILSQANSYFGLPAGSKLSQLIQVITQAFSQFLGLLSNKIDYTTMPVYADNAAAVAGGLAVTKPYKTPTGEVRVVV